MGVEKRRIIPLACPAFDREMENAAVNALRNERAVLGEDVFKFEEEFARYIGTRCAVSTSSGTNALQIALLSLGICGGDEVVTSAFSFVGSANAVIHASAVPKFSDIDAETFNVDPFRMSKAISKRTKALLPVHLYGHPCEMTEISDLAKDRGLAIVEDACQAHGAEYKGCKIGAIGDIGCFSFYPSKNMTVCGDGGMIVTNDEDIAKLADKLRDCGRKSHYEHDVIGFTSRLNSVNAAIGRVQLRRLDEWNGKRVKVASIYRDLLSDLEEISPPPSDNSDVLSVYHLYVVRAKNRDELMAYLREHGVQCGVHYPMPIPLQPAYRRIFGFKDGQYPVSELASRSCLSLPIFPLLSESDVTFISETIHKFYETSSI